MIMVGPGTGLAPMRGFLQERRAQLAAAGAEERDGAAGAHLYFGCRVAADYIYREELEGFESDGTLSELHVAFSRQSPTGKKHYVQHDIADNFAALWGMLQAGAHVFVCGDAKYMAPDVSSAIDKIVQGGAKADGWSETQVSAFLKKLHAENYHQDVWASNA